MSRRVHLVAPESVAGWLPYFRAPRDRDRVVTIGSAPTVDLARLVAACTGRVAVFVSAHETLLRDRALADHLRARGHRVECQSHRATLLGVDKLVMKEFLSAEGFATLPWQDPRAPVALSGPGPVVVKARHGTQSQGIRLEPIAGRPSRAEPSFAEPSYAEPSCAELREEYRDGVEYSVVVYRDLDRLVIFPPVWKGASGRALLPPWRRLRRCPVPDPEPDLVEELCRRSARIAQRAEVRGHLEVEYLVPAGGEPQVLELNPRVSGTLRLVAMATRIPVFSPHALPAGAQRLPALRLAAEVPHQGPHRYDPAGGVFATSRLTVAAGDLAGVSDKLRRHGAHPRWLAGLDPDRPLATAPAPAI